ncbi:amidase [Pontibacillus yanchengensis]|uniref:Amidase n=2 Tax=Pontibacillus yanchengensis TaxID=462910 RepID=A0ACC7VCT4_9BACI|nr:amidase [Pontibacillus yanchengensis]MYL35381.1 amidase [Pontibacillus yanchengensis]MYL52410.1 amidase [Pontibacillus yanchengensis]
MNIEERIRHQDALSQKLLMDNGELSSQEITDYYIQKIKQYNSKLNAVVHTMFEDASITSERANTHTGTLAGLPFLMKDLNQVKEYPVSSGSKMMQGYIANEDDIYVERYKKAGLVFVGKTNTPEFGFLPTTDPRYLGPARNPWSLSLSAGGSSGGSAAAVASGMIPFAHGSDGGGSIRIPASCCGVFGLKPSRGRGPYGIYMNDFAVSHALTRSVRDSAALLDVIKGKGVYEGYPSFGEDDLFLNEVYKQPRTLKVAISPDWNHQVTISEENRAALYNTVTLLKELGHDVSYETPEFDFFQFAKDFITVWIGSGSVIIKHMGLLAGTIPGDENLEPLSYDVYMKGMSLTALEYEEARVRLQLTGKKVLAFHENYDILVTPVLNGLPAEVGAFDNQKDAEEDMFDTMLNYVSFTQLANVTGQPSMSVPLYWTETNIPIGVQFTGRVGDEKKLFQLAAQLEGKQPWIHRYDEIDLMNT